MTDIVTEPTVQDIEAVGTSIEEESPITIEEQELLDSAIENSIPTISENYHNETLRFSGATWFNKIKEKIIILGGAGGISSNVAFQLSRVHPKCIYIYDNDKVEEVNLAGQMFSSKDIGYNKVDAVANTIRDYSLYKDAFAINELYTENSPTSDIMICGFDNMLARKIFFNNWLEHVRSKSINDRKKCLFIDGRLSFDTLQIFTIIGDDIYSRGKYQNEWLFNDIDADRTVCSLKQTTFMACMIASLIVNNVVNFCANEIEPMMKQLPFFIEYDCDRMYLKEE